MASSTTAKNFALIGAAGFIAPRHMEAIKRTGNKLVAALDPFDSVGVLDSYFPDTAFFIEPERFDRHLDKLRRGDGEKVDYVSICSPNYLHDAHIRLALRNDTNAICEKPLVLNPWNIDALQLIEKESGRKIFTILQLRHHPAIEALREKILRAPKDKVFDVELSYVTSRGAWYLWSWKGDLFKSGGVATNIGVHFFDMLTWIFGPVKRSVVHTSSAQSMAGALELDRANVRWFLSISTDDLPAQVVSKGGRAFRSLKLDGQEVEFSDGFTDLHTTSYRNILEGKGYGVQDARSSIELVHEIRNATPIGRIGEYHPLLAR